MAKNNKRNSVEEQPNFQEVEFFLKFGKKEHIERLRLHGEIYMGSMEYYRKHDNKEIQDPLEGITHVERCDRIQIFELNEAGNGPGKEIVDLSGKGISYPTEKIEGYLYCLYAVRKEELQALEKEGLNYIVLDPRLDNYDYVAFIKADEFIDRFETAFQENGVELHHGLVEYIDYYSHTGSLNQFNKYIIHRQQKEYRFFCPRRGRKGICFSIGSLEDICKIGLRKSNQHVRFARKS